MNNENIRPTSKSASISSKSTANVNATSTTSSLASISSSSSSLPLSSFHKSTSNFDANVNAITAVVNATTTPDAAVVVAVAVSSLAAAIIPDTPIVSIAGSTFSEITTTTTSTKTTPTPVLMIKENNTSKNVVKKEYLNSRASDSQQTLKTSSSPTDKQPHRQMSVANSSIQGVSTNAIRQTANDVAENDSQTTTCTLSKGSSTANKNTDSLSETTTNTTEVDTLPNQLHAVKIEINSVTSNEKSKDNLSDSWEERRLNDWDDNKLKELLDEAYSYKNPRDKENKSKTFLKLLEKVQNDDQSYPFRAITSRGSRNLSSSVTSNNYHHYSNPHYNSHSHNHNRSHHHHKQGGSLQDLFEIGLHEPQLDCEQSFGGGFGGYQRTKRQNHNSRQKKYSSSVSTRQREGGSLPSNVNVTHQISGSSNELGFMQQEGPSPYSAINKGNKKEHRRNVAKAGITAVPSTVENKDCGSITAADELSTNQAAAEITSLNAASYVAGGGDFIIDMGEPIIDIQQQQQILQSKGQDSTKQGQSFYDRLASIDKRLPRVNLIGSTNDSYFAFTPSQCYVDQAIRFNTLERNGGSVNHSSNAPTSSVEAKILSFDENYKACKSVLGGDDEKSLELGGKQKSNTIYSKISAPSSISAGLGGTASSIATITQRQLDENGNALSEIYQNSDAGAGAGAGNGTAMQINCVPQTTAIPATSGILLTSCGGNSVSTSATVTIPPHPTSSTVSASATITTYAAGPSQAKAKAKKKSQQERNTKTVDVESVAGYRGKDPVEELVKYIESSGEGGGGSTKPGEKRKERKKDKEKHQKLKKSNSLEELRSGAKMEVHELKRTAATTESNAVILRQKSGTGGGKQGKHNSSSTADINKNLESSKSSNASSRKSDRRSWGNEDLKYLEDQHNANFSIVNEDKSIAGPTTVNMSATNSNKERKNVKGTTTILREEKEIKDRTAERNERNLTNNIGSCNIVPQQQQPSEKSENKDKMEKPDRPERRKRYDTPPNAVTIIDIVPMESSCPETAEFHVVTKKKKPKKPKVVTSSEETSVTFNRTHNFTIQKSSTQSIPRYKYHQYEGNIASGNQQQQQQHNFNSIGVGGIAPNSYTSSLSQQNAEMYNNADKSRRKSTSSVPPSEKSDSSDLDSVHSLPIESTKANATKDISQQKMRDPKTGISPQGSSNKNNPHAPISYADIARTNKEIADAAAAYTVNETPFETKNLDSIAVDDKAPLDEKSNINVNNTVKTHKSKKSQIKSDFPELVGPVCIAPVSYSQSLSTATHTTQNQSTLTASDASASNQSDVINKASLPPPQQNHPQQNPQTLQKSKSVENDSTISNTYIAPLNSNSLDQQYPALEKTVKRHSSANISATYTTPNQTSSFNFAAAAKQQIATNITESTNVNCNKNLALTTSTNTNTQVAPIAANNVTTSITTTNTNNNTNRKSKEKSPPINSQNMTQDSLNLKKSKKERQQLQQSVDSSTTSQSKSSNATISRKPYRQLKNSTSSPTSTQINPRPAVIILNDDRNSSACDAENQFTFGDFNEDELKMFEDDVTSTNNHIGNTANIIENQANADDQQDSAAATYFNDSGASCENDMVNNSTSDMLLNSSIDASSPNTSFANNIHASRGGGCTSSSQMAAHGNNQSSDSGIYTDKIKSTSCGQQATGRRSKQTSPTKDDNKLNTFLSNTKCASVHTSMDSLDPPPQQLETCNEIETAIIAAARAAATHQQKHQQQQQIKNSNSSSNSSSFSSSSLSSTAPYHCSGSKTLNQHGNSSNNISYNQSSQYDSLYDVADDDEAFNNTPRSRSPSRPRRISIQYIPPAMATALTTQQHNEIIIDFIGSAWEEIANSKVTKVYDGQ